jgi:FMN phosphatase YigB (HAD superfamily)
MNLRAIIFDIYATLLEVGPPPPDADTRWRQLFRDALKIEPPLTRLDFSIAASKVITRHHEAARARGIPWPEVYWPAIINEVIPELAQLSAHDQSEFIFWQIGTGHTTRMTADAAATLSWLKERQFRLGIASNAQPYTLREVEEALSVHSLGLSLFDPQLCVWSFEHGFSKPDPHVFQILTARLAAVGISPAETVMIGDRRDNDVEPARAHGWHAWHLSPAGDGGWSKLREWLENPTHKPPNP